MNAIVKLNLKHDGNEYAPSADVQDIKGITKAEATSLVAAGVIELPEKAKSAKADGNQAED